MKALLLCIALLASAISFAEDCKGCSSKSGAACAEGKLMASSNRVLTLNWDSGLKGDCQESREASFWATAQSMLLTSEDGKMPWPMMSFGKSMDANVLSTKTEGACDKSTAQKKIAKGAEGCCNAKGSPAAFKVWAGGQYHFFGCADSAAQGRNELNMRGMVAGNVQPVSEKKSTVN